MIYLGTLEGDRAWRRKPQLLGRSFLERQASRVSRKATNLAKDTTKVTKDIVRNVSKGNIKKAGSLIVRSQVNNVKGAATMLIPDEVLAKVRKGINDRTAEWLKARMMSVSIATLKSSAFKAGTLTAAGGAGAAIGAAVGALFAGVGALVGAPIGGTLVPTTTNLIYDSMRDKVVSELEAIARRNARRLVASKPTPAKAPATPTKFVRSGNVVRAVSPATAAPAKSGFPIIPAGIAALLLL